jgi:hypothetical protein
MHRSSWTPSIVPYGADQTGYLVIDRFDGLGSVYREAEVERTDLETVITDLMSGRFNDPIRVVAFKFQKKSLSKSRPDAISMARTFQNRSGTLPAATRGQIASAL